MVRAGWSLKKLSINRETAVSSLFPFSLLLLFLTVAAYLRLRGLEHSPILGDQSILLNIGMRFVNTGEIPLAANKSSAGIMNPPLIAYLLSLPLFIRTTLTAVHLFQGLMGVTAVAVLAIYAQRLFGWRVALLATFLFAVNPWAVYYSRFIWNPNPIPLFATLLFTKESQQQTRGDTLGWGSLIADLHAASVDGSHGMLVNQPCVSTLARQVQALLYSDKA